jgi:hypothetical protein
MRNRDLLGSSRSATAPAKLPALDKPRVEDPALARWINAVTERLQVREGQRGNALEQVVTRRDLEQTYGLRSVITAAGKPGTVLVQDAKGNTIALSGEHFAEMIRGTKLYKDLMRGINDPARFDDLGERVKALLLPDLGELAAKVGAGVRQVDVLVQNATESFAARKTEVTAAVDKHVAGLRQTFWAEANNIRATAGAALQLTARLDDVAGSGASIEEVYSVVADEDTGLSAQAYLKLTAGGAIAGWGASAEAPIGGTPTSYFIIVADNFAVVDPDEVAGVDYDPLAPAAGRIPFSISGGVVRINGSLEVGSSGTTLNDLASLAGISISTSSQFFKVDSTGSPVNSTVTLGIVFSSGLSGTVTWSHGSGYSGSTPSGTNTWVVDAADQDDDAVTYTAAITIGGVDYTDTITIVRLRDGTDALTAVLTNEAQTVPADASGVIATYAGASGTFQVFRGSTLLATPTVAFSYVSSSGFSTAPSSSINATTGAYAITANINAEVASVTYRATVGTSTLDKTFTITKVRQGGTGAAGASAKLLQIIATSDIFSVAADGSTSTPTSITFSANGQNLSGSPLFTVVSGSGTATLSGAGSNVLQFADLATDSVTIQVAQDGLTDTVTVAKVRAGTHSITIVAPNQAHALPADNAGTVSSYSGSGTALQVFEGATALTYVTTSPAAGQYNITPSVTTGTITAGSITGATTTTATVGNHSAMTTDVAVILYTFSGKRADGSTFLEYLSQTLTKSKTGAAGANGADSTSYSLLATPSAISLTAASAYNPTTVAFSSTSKTGAAAVGAYAGRFKIYESADGSTWPAATYTSSANESSKTFTPAAGKKAIKCELYLAGGTSTLLDTTVVPVLAEGTDAVTAVVANPAQTVPASTAGVVSSYASTGTTIQIYEGATLLTFTTGSIGNSKYTCGTPTISPAAKITAGARSGNGTTTLTVADHSAMDDSTDRVTITYPILVQKSGGTQVNLSLVQVITKAKIGATGAAGTPGTAGAAGARGSLTGDGLYWGLRLGADSAWVDGHANRVIDNMANGVAVGASGSDTTLASSAGNRVGDRVTLSNGPPWQAVQGTLSFTTTVWSNATNYAVNSYVTRTGGTYRALLASGPAGVGAKDPATQPTYWLQVYPNTTWRNTTDYVQNQYVIQTSASTTSIYRALKASGPNTVVSSVTVGAQDPGTTTGYWQLITSGATARTSWANTTVYSQYDYLTDSGTVYFANFRHTSGTILIGGVASLSADQTAQQVSIFRTWTGTAWAPVVAYFDGNVVVTGSLSGDKLYGGTITGVSMSVGPNTEFVIDGSTGVVSSKSFFGYNSNFGNLSNPTLPCIKATTYATSSGAAVEAIVDYVGIAGGSNVAVLATSKSPNSNAHAIRGTWNKFGTSANPGRGVNNGVYASGLIGVTNGNAFYAEAGAVGPFTGSHEGAIKKRVRYTPGDIVVDVACLMRNGYSNTFFEVFPSTKANQRGVVGVITHDNGPMNRVTLIAACPGELIADETGVVSGPPEFEAVKNAYKVVQFNALGEGQINVCGQGGDIEQGDFIVASDMRGKGMRQADDVVRGCTVAKARESVTFESASEVKTIACIYMAG